MPGVGQGGGNPRGRGIQSVSQSQGLPGSDTHSSRKVRLFPSSSRSTIQGRQTAPGSLHSLHMGTDTPGEGSTPREPKNGLATHVPKER